MDIFTVVLQQSQACSLMTPTLVSGPGAQPRDMGAGEVRHRPSQGPVSVGGRAVLPVLTAAARLPPGAGNAHLYSCLSSVLADRLP